MFQSFNRKATAVLCAILMLWTPTVGVGDPTVVIEPSNAVLPCENTEYSQLSEGWSYLDEQRSIYQTLFGVDDLWMDYVDPDTLIPNYADRDILFPLNEQVTGPGLYHGTTRHGFDFTVEVTHFTPVDLRPLVAGSAEQEQLIAEIAELIEDPTTADQLIQSLTDNSITETEYAESIEADQVSKAQVGGTVSTGTAGFTIFGETTHGIDAETGASASYLQIQGLVDQCGVLFQDLIEIPEEPDPANGDQAQTQADADDNLNVQNSQEEEGIDDETIVILALDSRTCDDCYNNANEKEAEAWDQYNEDREQIDDDLERKRENIRRERDRKINTITQRLRVNLTVASLKLAAAIVACGLPLLMLAPPAGPWVALGCALTATAVLAITMYEASAMAEVEKADVQAEADNQKAAALAEAQDRAERIWETLQEKLAQIEREWCDCVTALECLCDGGTPCSVNCNSLDDPSVQEP